MTREDNFRLFYARVSQNVYGVSLGKRSAEDQAEIAEEIREMGQELNDHAQARYGRDWEDLTQSEREVL